MRRGETTPGGSWALISDRRFLRLAMTEFWERFAMAGIKSILVVSLADHVLAGDLADVLGAPAMHHLLATWFGVTSPKGMASQIYGYAIALLYASVLVGGLVGDLVLGRRGGVLWGGCVMCAGLALMTTPLAFLPGLALFAVGAGTLKANLAAQLGGLFTIEADRQRGYAVYLGFLNAGAVCGPLVCGTLAATIGWSYAMVAAGIALAIALVGYARSPLATVAVQAPALLRSDGSLEEPRLREGGVLAAAILSIYCCYAAYEQLGDAFLLWARKQIDLRIAGWPMPASWFLSLDAALTLLLIAGWQALAPRLARRGIILDAISQILLGSLFCGAGYLILALASGDHRGPVPLGVSLAYLLFVDIAIVLIWPSGLSLIAAMAPPRLAGFWTGLFYLHGFFANLWVGIGGSYFGRIPDQRFWLLHALIATLGAILAVIARLLQQRPRPSQAMTTSA